jgi:hypothetical protein
MPHGAFSFAFYSTLKAGGKYITVGQQLIGTQKQLTANGFPQRIHLTTNAPVNLHARFSFRSVDGAILQQN